MIKTSQNIIIVKFQELLSSQYSCPPSFAASVEPLAEPFTLYVGDRLDLSCSAKDSSHTANWAKDHVPVVDGEHARIRNGQLEIESVELSDSGFYMCTTFNNHSVYFNVTGKVMETGRILSFIIFQHTQDNNTVQLFLYFFYVFPLTFFFIQFMSWHVSVIISMIPFPSLVYTMASSEDDDDEEESSSEETKLLGSQKLMRKCADLLGLTKLPATNSHYRLTQSEALSNCYGQ